VRCKTKGLREHEVQRIAHGKNNNSLVVSTQGGLQKICRGSVNTQEHVQILRNTHNRQAFKPQTAKYKLIMLAK